MRGFRNDNDGYARWIDTHPNGFVVNVDVPQRRPEYPMVHSSQHKLLSSDEVGGYTDGDYEKVCSDDLTELEEWSKENHGKRLTYCKSPKCQKAFAESEAPDLDKIWS